MNDSLIQDLGLSQEALRTSIQAESAVVALTPRQDSRPSADPDAGPARRSGSTIPFAIDRPALTCVLASSTS